MSTMTMLLTFAAALVSTTLAGVIAYFIFKHFASNRAASIAAFWLTVGAAGRSYSFSGPLTEDAAIAFSAFLGAALAILILWRWLLKRPVGEVSGADM
jgi:hypothetical protein